MVTHNGLSYIDLAQVILGDWGPLVCPALGQWCGTHTYLGVGIPGLPRVRPVVAVVAPPERESAGPAALAKARAARRHAPVCRSEGPCEGRGDATE